jgi:hypothetical protein
MAHGRFAPLDQRNRIGTLQHAVGLHVDPSKLRDLVKGLAIAAGVEHGRIEGRGVLRIITKPLRSVEAKLGQGHCAPYTAVSRSFDQAQVSLAEGDVLSIYAPQTESMEDPWQEGALRIGPASMTAPMEVFGPWRLFLNELSWLVDLLPAEVPAFAEARQYGCLFRTARDELTSMSGHLRGEKIQGDDLFSKRGFLMPSDGELFTSLDWTKAFLARDCIPEHTDPMAERSDRETIAREITALEARITAVVRNFPPYAKYLDAVRRAAGA